MWSINFPVTTTVIARKVITFPTTHRDKNYHLKAEVNYIYLLPLVIRDFFPYFKVANLSFTHLYTTTTYFNLKIKLISRSISMCQVLGQCSVRAIIKLFIFFLYVIEHIYIVIYITYLFNF